jgi:hypothetical protein
MSITWEISELDGGSKDRDRALKACLPVGRYAASLAGVARRPQTKPPARSASSGQASAGGIKAMPCAWGRP